VLAIGGGMANTFLAAQGHDVGKSLCEHDLADTARIILEKVMLSHQKISKPMQRTAHVVLMTLRLMK